MNEDPRMTAIARSFPSLRGAPGVDPWDVNRLGEWAATSPAVTHGSRHAARFVLAAWNEDAPESFGLGPFRMMRAWQTWDDAHRAAALAFLRDPYFP